MSPKLLTAAVIVGVATITGVTLASGEEHPRVPAESMPVIDAPAPLPDNGNAHVTPPTLRRVDKAAVQAKLAPSFSLLKAVANPSAPETEVKATDGTPFRVWIGNHGLCIHVGGITGCGDPNAATTRPMIIHSPDLVSEVVSGIVPDTVQSIQIQGGSGDPVTVEPHENVFNVRVPGRTATLKWALRDGSTIQQLP